MRLGKNRGFTLLELLSYLAVSSVLLLAMILFFNSVLKKYVFVSERITLKKISSMLLRNVNGDLELSNPQSIHVADKTTAIQRISAVTGMGEIAWSEDMVLYRFSPEEHRVLRWTVPTNSLVPGSEPGSLEAVTAGQIEGLSPQKSRVWGQMDDFQIEKTAQRTVRVSMKLSLRDTKGKLHELGRHQEITLFNDRESP